MTRPRGRKLSALGLDSPAPGLDMTTLGQDNTALGRRLFTWAGHGCQGLPQLLLVSQSVPRDLSWGLILSEAGDAIMFQNLAIFH